MMHTTRPTTVTMSGAYRVAMDAICTFPSPKQLWERVAVVRTYLASLPTSEFQNSEESDLTPAKMAS